MNISPKRQNSLNVKKKTKKNPNKMRNYLISLLLKIISIFILLLLIFFSIGIFIILHNTINYK